MANRRVLVKRRKAVTNIRKITRTMQLIATARFQAAFQRAMATKPYSEKLAELVADLSRAAGSADHPLLRTNDAEREAMCAHWARELERLPGVSSGPEGDGGDASDRLGKMFHDRQLRASELGMRMMVESCGCDDFD